MSDSFGTVFPQSPALSAAGPADNSRHRRRPRVSKDCLLRDKFFAEIRTYYNISQIRGQVQPAIQLYFVTVMAQLGRRIGAMLNMANKKTITVEEVLNAARFLHGVDAINIEMHNIESEASKKQRRDYHKNKPVGALSKPPNKFAALHGKVHWEHFKEALKGCTGIKNVRLGSGETNKSTFQGENVLHKEEKAANTALAYCLTLVYRFMDDLKAALEEEVRNSKSKTSAKGFFDRHLSEVAADPVHASILGAAAVRVVCKRAKRPQPEVRRRSTASRKSSKSSKSSKSGRK